MAQVQAEIVLPTQELRDDIPFFQNVLGMRMDTIFPADDPSVAVFSGHGLRVRVDKDATTQPGKIRILAEDPSTFADGAASLMAPNGTEIEIAPLHPLLIMPETQHSFMVRRLADQAPWVIGRAGMHYRDLIPDRLGGSIIASHIRIPDGGPVPDSVHYHTVGFQLIFCYRGWVDLVYEDQGEPFRLFAGNCVIQPPEIRHQVLYASDNIEVIEIGVPAEHITTLDHSMKLPTPDFRIPGFISRDTTIAANTRDVAGVEVVRSKGTPTQPTRHTSDILFTFVMEGGMTLLGEDGASHRLSPGDAFVVPPDMVTTYSEPSEDLELLEVSLPGAFETHLA